MSLSEAVLAIADEMEKSIDDVEAAGKIALRIFASQLRIAVKAAESHTVFSKDIFLGEAKATMQLQTEREAKKAKKITQEDEACQNMTQIKDGELAGTMVPIDPRMPIGARTNVGGVIYELRQDRMLYIVKK